MERKEGGGEQWGLCSLTNYCTAQGWLNSNRQQVHTGWQIGQVFVAGCIYSTNDPLVLVSCFRHDLLITRCVRHV